MIRLIRYRTWAFAIVSALLQILIFPMAGPLPLWRAWLGWLALVPFLLALLDTDRKDETLSIQSASLVGYVCGLLFYSANCYWIYQTMYLYGGLPKAVSFGILILFSLYLGLYHALFAGLFAIIRKGSRGIIGPLLGVPFLWVSIELARGQITGFPWDLLGYSQVDNLLLTRLAPYAGVMAISFILVVVNTLVVLCWQSSGRKRWLAGGLALVLALILQAGGSFKRPIGPASQVAVLMQENLAVGVKGRDVIPLSPQEEVEMFTAMSLQPATEASLQRRTAALIVWPEAPAHLQSNDPFFRKKMGDLARRAQAPVIAGSLGVDVDPSARRGYFLYDSASLFSARGNYAGRYDKIHLVPWGEYVPFKRFFAFAQKLTEGAGDMDPGHDRSVFHAGGRTYGIFICYESIFGEEVRQFAKNGAEVLVNISDDGWYGDTGAPWQHLNMARMRAIENRRWVVRSTNTGVTTTIDPMGRMAAQAPRHVRGAFGFAFDFVSETTFYTRHGDWFAWMCAVLTMTFIVWSVARRPGVRPAADRR